MESVCSWTDLVFKEQMENDEFFRRRTPEKESSPPMTHGIPPLSETEFDLQQPIHVKTEIDPLVTDNRFDMSSMTLGGSRGVLGLRLWRRKNHGLSTSTIYRSGVLRLIDGIL